MSLLVVVVFLGIALFGMPLALSLGAAAVAGLMASNVDFNLLPSRMMSAVNAFPLIGQWQKGFFTGVAPSGPGMAAVIVPKPAWGQ